MCAWRLLKIEELRKLNDDEIIQRVNDLLAPELTGTSTWILEPADVAAADFYMKELDRRENRREEAKRDEIESDRWRIDFGMERRIIQLIIAELALTVLVALVGFYEQSKDLERQLQAFGKVQLAIEGTTQNVAKLQKSTDETVKSISLLNDKMQRELDLYYEPSVLLVYRRIGTAEIAEVHNYGRTSIAIVGAMSHMRSSGTVTEFTRLREPLTISTGSFNSMGSDLVSRLIRDVIVSGGGVPLTIYFRAENGTVWEHHANVNRCPVMDGPCVTLENQRSEPIVWTNELARNLGRKGS